MIKIKKMLYLALPLAVGIRSEGAASSSQSGGVQTLQAGMPQESFDWSEREIVFRYIGGSIVNITSTTLEMFNKQFRKMMRNIKQHNRGAPHSFRFDFPDITATFVFDTDNLLNQSGAINVTIINLINTQILHELYQGALHTYRLSEKDRLIAEGVNEADIRIEDMNFNEFKSFHIDYNDNGQYLVTAIDDGTTFETGRSSCFEYARFFYIRPLATLEDVGLDAYIFAKCIESDARDCVLIQIADRTRVNCLHSFFKNIKFAHPTQNVPPSLQAPVGRMVDRLNAYFEDNAHFEDNFESPLISLSMTEVAGYQIKVLKSSSSPYTSYFYRVEFTNTLNNNIVQFMIPIGIRPIIIISIQENITVDNQGELNQAFNERVNNPEDIIFISKSDQNTICLVLSKERASKISRISSMPNSIYRLCIKCNDGGLIFKGADNKEYIMIDGKIFKFKFYKIGTDALGF